MISSTQLVEVAFVLSSLFNKAVDCFPYHSSFTFLQYPAIFPPHFSLQKSSPQKLFHFTCPFGLHSLAINPLSRRLLWFDTMATTPALRISVPFMIFLLILNGRLVTPQSNSEMNLQFYMHDNPMPPNPSAVQVATQQTSSGSLAFGSTFVIDDLLTEGPDPTSSRVGRAQGMYSMASQTDMNLHLHFTAIMEKAEYNGSTLAIHGADRIGLASREVAVVGGTGVFRFARGFATMETASQNGPNAVLKFNVTLHF
eukprot:c3701_g1_i1 orf=567-1331(-)